MHNNRELVVNIDKKELGTDKKKPVGAYLLNKKEARALILHTTHWCVFQKFRFSKKDTKFDLMFHLDLKINK